ncbi:hypothetical protein C8R30_1258 [Nitrosomonas nitrosa]|nr:hypothetical protein C8R30_1258 [Nitrosomonas nitrosa]
MSQHLLPLTQISYPEIVSATGERAKIRFLDFLHLIFGILTLAVHISVQS